MTVKLSNAAREYDVWRDMQGFAKATRRNDRSALRHLERAIGDLPVDQIDNDKITHALHRMGETCGPSSVNMHHASLSAFFRWCRMKGYISPDADPLMGIRYKKVGKRDRRRLAAHEFPPLLDAAKTPRERILIALGIYLFLRSSEAVSLRVRDVDLQSGTIGVTIFKTHDYDIMPISRELDTELRRWLLAYQEECGELHPDWYLVPAKKTIGLHTFALNPTAKISRPEDLVKETLRRYGWDDTHWQGMHCLRASGARAWFDELDANTVDGALRIVQTHLHHSSVTMTERYLGITADRAKRDRILKGESMFPSLQATNVTPINRTA